jgi:hypothetical protein
MAWYMCNENCVLFVEMMNVHANVLHVEESVIMSDCLKARYIVF